MYKVLEDETLCFGCQACYEACPTQVIDMVKDTEGFLFPKIDSNNCIECGKCKDVCPVLHMPPRKEFEQEYYAVMGSDEIRYHSSSGGAFTFFVNEIFLRNGVVCGAEFTQDYRNVRHMIYSKEDNWDRLRKSKYIQSDVNHCYPEIKKQLEGDRFVLFTGTPCQVAGLKNYLGKDYSNLYCMDFLCHAVSSADVWNAFLEDTSKGKNIVKADFKDKCLGWSATLSIDYEDHSRYVKERYDSLWYKAYLNDLISRKSCYTCPYPYRGMCSDITVGDFWNIDKIKEGCNDGLGTSYVCINTSKGKELFLAAAHDLEWHIERVTESLAKSSQIVCRNNCKQHPGRNKFFQALNEGTNYSTAVLQSMNKKYDYGIVGYWYTNNYGAVFTSYAINKVLNKMGYSSILIDVPDMIYADRPSYRDNDDIGRQFIQKHCNISARYRNMEEARSLNSVCDGFLVGSDSLWEYYDYTQGWGFNFLEFADDTKMKISYGTSFGADGYDPTMYDLNAVKYFLRRMDAISVREDTGVTICQERFDVDATHVLDPVFLLEQSEYTQLFRDIEVKRKLVIPNQYILLYMLQPTKDKLAVIDYVAQQNGLPIIYISDLWEDSAKYYSSEDISYKPVQLKSIEEWLLYIAQSSMVITDSYHGFCFSIIFNKKFICLKPRSGFARFSSLALLLDITDYIGVDYEIIQSKYEELIQINYKEINRALIKERNRSYEWLKSALNESHTKEKENISYDMTNVMIQREVQKMRNALKSINSYLSVSSKIAVKIFLQERLKNCKVAIKGAGMHTIHILKLVGDRIDIKCIMAKNAATDYEWPYPVIEDKEITNYDVDTIVISSYKFRDSMKRDLQKFSNQYTIIDIYDCLDEQGIHLEDEFFNVFIEL